MISSRQDLIEYGLRKCGAPVLSINVAPEQIEDRLDEALQFYQEYHSEAINKTLFKHAITASQLLIINPVGTFAAGDVVTGSVTGAEFTIYDVQGMKLRTREFRNATPLEGETLTSDKGATASVAPGSIAIGDTQNKYITVGDEIMSVLKVFPFHNQSSGANYMFDARYQLMMSEIYNLNQSGLNYYYSVQQHLSLINFLLTHNGSLQFNRAMNRIELNTDWENKLLPDQILLFEVYASIDATTHTKTLNDIFLKRYFVALLKQQWAQNLSKYQELELPGGVKLNASAMMTEAREDLKQLEEEVLKKFSAPLAFFVG